MRSWFFLFSCNLMWALQFTCVKLVQDQVGSLFTVWGPMTLATLMLYPLIRSERGKEGATKTESNKRSEEHTSELQSPCNLVCRLLLEKKNYRHQTATLIV